MDANSLPSLRTFWELLDSYDWASYLLEIEEGAALSSAWYAKYDAVYRQIHAIADVSEPHEQLAAEFESAMQRRDRKPTKPLC